MIKAAPNVMDLNTIRKMAEQGHSTEIIAATVKVNEKAVIRHLEGVTSQGLPLEDKPRARPWTDPVHSTAVPEEEEEEEEEEE